MPPLVLPLSPYLSGDRWASAPLARHEAVCFPSGQAHSSGAVQGEDMRTPPSPRSPVLGGNLPRRGGRSGNLPRRGSRS